MVLVEPVCGDAQKVRYLPYKKEYKKCQGGKVEHVSNRNIAHDRRRGTGKRANPKRVRRYMFERRVGNHVDDPAGKRYAERKQVRKEK